MIDNHVIPVVFLWFSCGLSVDVPIWTELFLDLMYVCVYGVCTYMYFHKYVEFRWTYVFTVLYVCTPYYDLIIKIKYLVI